MDAHRNPTAPRAKLPTLGLILARGGSKGLPGKNIRPLAGKPLIAWTIEAARQCPEIDRLVLSTDDHEIATVAQAWGCDVPFLRPAALATDEAKAIDVVFHALAAVGGSFERVVLLQPTSPLRLTGDITACARLCEGADRPAGISVCAAVESPYWMFTLSRDGSLNKIVPDAGLPLRRQELPPAFLVNGAVYAAWVPWLRQHSTFLGPGVRAHVMPPERSIDIDTLEDFKTAEQLIAGR